MEKHEASQVCSVHQVACRLSGTKARALFNMSSPKKSTTRLLAQLGPQYKTSSCIGAGRVPSQKVFVFQETMKGGLGRLKKLTNGTHGVTHEHHVLGCAAGSCHLLPLWHHLLRICLQQLTKPVSAKWPTPCNFLGMMDGTRPRLHHVVTMHSKHAVRLNTRAGPTHSAGSSTKAQVTRENFQPVRFTQPDPSFRHFFEALL